MKRLYMQIPKSLISVMMFSAVVLAWYLLLVGTSHSAECGSPADTEQFSINRIEFDGIEIQESSSPTVRIDSNNRIHLLTVSSMDNKIYYLNDSSGKLQVVSTIQPEQSGFVRAAMEVNDSGQPVIVFSVTAEIETTSVNGLRQDYRSEIFYTKIVDGQAIPPASAAMFEEKIYRVLMRLDQQETIHIAFTATTESMEQALLSNFYYSHNRSGTFTEPIAIAASVPELMDACLEIGDNDLSYAFGIVRSWEPAGFKIMRWSVDPQGGVTEETVYSNAGQQDVAPQILNLSITLESDNVSHLFFRETDLYYINDASAIFSTPEKIADLREDRVWMGNVSILTPGPNGVYAVFNEPASDTCWNQYYWSRQSGDNTAPILAANSEGIVSSNFCLHIDDEGYLQWLFGGYIEDAAGNYWEIFQAKSNEPVEEPVEEPEGPEDPEDPDSSQPSSSSGGGCFIGLVISE